MTVDAWVACVCVQPQGWLLYRAVFVLCSSDESGNGGGGWVFLRQGSGAESMACSNTAPRDVLSAVRRLRQR